MKLLNSNKVYDRLDSKGFKTSHTLMNITGLNIFGAVSWCGKMMDNVELLSNEISHNVNG